MVKSKVIMLLKLTILKKTFSVPSKERGVFGKFDDGPPPMIIVRAENCSELTMFHEKVHMQVWYNKMPKMHIVDEEKYVFEAIFKFKDTHKWTNDELIDAYNYINDIVIKWNNRGKNFPIVQNEFINQIIFNKSIGL